VILLKSKLYKFIFLEYLFGLGYTIGFPIFGGMLYYAYPPFIVMFPIGLAGFFGIIPPELSYRAIVRLGSLTMLIANTVPQAYIVYNLYRIAFKSEMRKGILTFVCLHHLMYSIYCATSILTHLQEISHLYYLSERLYSVVYSFRVPLNAYVAFAVWRSIHESD